MIRMADSLGSIFIRGELQIYIWQVMLYATAWFKIIIGKSIVWILYYFGGFVHKKIK